MLADARTDDGQKVIVHSSVLIRLLFCELVVTPACNYKPMKAVKIKYWFLAFHVKDKDQKLNPTSSLV